MGYLFINDMKYYLNYLDFLYDEERAERQYGKVSEGDESYQPQRYYPQSSYIVLEIVIKAFIAATTIIMF